MNTTKARKALVASLITLTLAAGCSVGTSDSDVEAMGTEVAATAAVSQTTSAAAQTVSTESATAGSLENQESHASADDLEYDESSVVEVFLDGDTAASESGDVTIDGSTITIAAAGVYSLTGTLTDGEVIVDAGDTADVTLILDGVDIINTDGAAVAIMSADEAIVLLEDDTTNRLTDSSSYTFADADTDEPNATLYSASDLTIAGGGELVVTASYNDGITSKDGLVIESGTISVDAVDDGIRGKDYVIVNGGDIDVVAGGDGIKADNDEDADRGYVLIADGDVALTSGDDGVQAATDALVTGGRLTVTAGTTTTTDESGRGIQGDVMVEISGGTIIVEASDDAIHSNESVTINGGDLTLSSGDDGIHADYAVTINNGTITITESFEGIEAEVITINDGQIDLTAADDGLNVTSATIALGDNTHGPGGGGGETAGEYYLYINGGTTVITITGGNGADGDGIDSNGHVVMTGGVVVVNGPTDTRNSAIDYNGTFTVSGGVLVGTNINGRNSEGIGEDSTQASMYLTFDTLLDAGTVVHIQTADGTGLVTIEPANEFDVIVFTSPDLQDGGEYEIYLGGSVSGESTFGLFNDSVYTPGDLAGAATATL